MHHKTGTKRGLKSKYDLHGDLEKIKAAISDATWDAKGRANEIFNDSLERVRDKSEEFQTQATQYVRKKPFKSVGLSMLAGMVVGYLMRK